MAGVEEDIAITLLIAKIYWAVITYQPHTFSFNPYKLLATFHYSHLADQRISSTLPRGIQIAIEPELDRRSRAHQVTRFPMTELSTTYFICKFRMKIFMQQAAIDRPKKKNIYVLQYLIFTKNISIVTRQKIRTYGCVIQITRGRGITIFFRI